MPITVRAQKLVLKKILLNECIIRTVDLYKTLVFVMCFHIIYLYEKDTLITITTGVWIKTQIF